MTWKETLRKLELAEEWDNAIEFMQHIIQEYPDDMNTYIYMNFLLMNLLVEEDYDDTKVNTYVTLAKHYFNESYKKFHNNAEYLFYTGKTAYMSVWHFGIDYEDADNMLNTALAKDPTNLVYQSNYYISLNYENSHELEQMKIYAHKILKKDPSIYKPLQSKGAIGAYILKLLNGWAEKVTTNSLKIR